MVRVRTKKINPKTNLAILRESDIPDFDGDNAALEAADKGIDANTGLPKVESGVESKEEKVCHVMRFPVALLAFVGVPSPLASKIFEIVC